MEIYVNKNFVEFDANSKVNKREFKATPLDFIFTEEYRGLTCKAVFSPLPDNEEMKFYQVPILDNKCYIPEEVMGAEGILIGVYGYEVKGDDLIIRYSPSPKKLWFLEGSYYEGAETPEEITPSQFEQYIAYLNNEINRLNQMGIKTTKVSGGVKLDITNADGSTESATIHDGEEGPIGPEGPEGPAGRDGVVQYTAGDNINISSENIISADLSSKQDILESGENIKTINNNSILGSGNIVIAVNPTVITSSESSYTISSLTGNNVYKLSELTSLIITSVSLFDVESIIYFTSGVTPTSVSIPDSLINIGDVPTFTSASNVSTGTCEASKSYIISVLNNIAVWKAY